MSSAQPKVTGTFAKTPLLHVLTSLLEQTASGTLVIEGAEGDRSALVVERGVPVKMRLGQPTMRLGEILVELGWIRREVAQSTYAQSTSLGQLHGRVLVHGGHIDQDVLELGLRAQVVKKLQWAAALPADTVFGFYEAVDYLAKWRGGATPVGPLVAMWLLARSRAEPAVVATVIHRISGISLRLHPKAQPRSFGFDRAEMAVLDVLRAKPQPMSSLLRLGLVAPHTLERMVYVMTLTRHLDFGRGLVPLGVDAVTEREESLLLPKESLRPSRPVVLSATTAPEDTLRIGLEQDSEVERLEVTGGNALTVSALDAIGVGTTTKPVSNATAGATTADATTADASSKPEVANLGGAEAKPRDSRTSVDAASRATPEPDATNMGAAEAKPRDSRTSVDATSRATPYPGVAAQQRKPTPVPGSHHPGSDRPSAIARRSASPAAGIVQAKPVATIASTVVGDRRTQIEKLAVSIAQLNHFEVLGLQRDAPAANIQDTYLKLAKQYHPDRLPAELADLKPLATKIFARMSEAHQTLSDGVKRAQYLEHLSRGVVDDEEEKIRKVLRAAGAFQKAEVLLKKRMLAAAELEANRALEDDPEQADYLALYAWIQACKPDSEPRLLELCNMLTQAITRNPNSEKNRFYRAQLFKRLGQVDKAVADCRVIAEKNPHHVDALREIRLWDMRRAQKHHPTATARGTNPGHSVAGRSPSDASGVTPSTGKKNEPQSTAGGLLGRLFKR